MNGDCEKEGVPVSERNDRFPLLHEEARNYADGAKEEAVDTQQQDQDERTLFRERGKSDKKTEQYGEEPADTQQDP